MSAPAFSRRRFVLGSAAWLGVSGVSAQQAVPGPRAIGMLSPLPAPTPDRIAASPLTARLRELGWVEGGNLRIERAFAGWREDRFPELAAELVAKRVDVIWAISPQAAVAAARATRAIPIVFAAVANPVEQGLVESLSRPGRNATGVAYGEGIGFGGQKRLELLKEVRPGAKRVAWLRSVSASAVVDGGAVAIDAQYAIARKLGLDFQDYPVRSREDMDVHLRTIPAGRIDVMLVGNSGFMVLDRKRVVDFAVKYRIPSLYLDRSWVEAGGLMSYGTDFLWIVLQSLGYVDRVLRGARPADLPVELPSKYELAVNLGAAKAIGLKLPQSVMLRADKVIE